MFKHVKKGYALFAIFLSLLFTSRVAGQKPKLVVPIGHFGVVTSAVFSPDGQTILTGSGDLNAKLWNLRGEELQLFSAHEDRITAVAFSPDGQKILTAGWDKTVRLWDLTGELIGTFKGHTYEYAGSTWNSSITAVAFSPDGQTFLTGGSKDKTAQLWNLKGKVLHTFSGHTGGVTSVAFSPDGKKILTGSEDKTAKLWDLQGIELHTFSGHTGSVTAVAFSRDGQQIVTGSADKTARLWDLEGAQNQTFTGHADELTSVAIFTDANNAQKILTGSKDKTARLWNVSGEEIKVFSGHGWFVTSVAFSPDGKSVLTSSWDKTAKLWNMEGKQVQTLTGKGAGMHSVAFSPDGESILSGTWYDAANLWNLRKGSIQTFTTSSSNVYAKVAFSPDSQKIVTVGVNDGKLWDYEGKVLQTFSHKRTDEFSAVTFSPDGQTVFTGNMVPGGASEGQLWNLKGELLQTFTGHKYGIQSVAFSPDGQKLLTGGTADGKAKLWNLKGEEIKVFSNYNTIFSVAFSPDGSKVLTGHDYAAQPAALWDVDDKESTILTGHSLGVMSVAFSPNGKTILTGSKDRTARLWDLDGKVLQVLEGHNSWVKEVAFSPDGRWLLTMADVIKIWDALNGKEMITLVPFRSGEWLVKSPSGLFDASAGALNFMYFSVFNEEAREYEAVGVEQLKARYYEPGLLQKVLGYSRERIRPVQNFEAVALYPKVRTAITGDKLRISLEERNGGIGKVSVFINGKEVEEDVNPLPAGKNTRRADEIEFDLRPYQNLLFRHPDSTNTVGIRVYNEEGWLKSRSIDLVYNPKLLPRTKGRKTTNAGENPNWMATEDPTLFVVAIGTSDYFGTDLDLTYADQDAAVMAKALNATGDALFKGADGVETYCLTTSHPDSIGLPRNSISWHYPAKDSILKVFEEIKAKGKAEDILIVYLSGHGLAKGGRDRTEFYYLTEGVAREEDLDDPGLRAKYTISSEELTKWINEVPALKQVLIIDACNSGQVVENLTGGTKDLNTSQIRALDRMKDRTGMFILSGSASDKVSYEASEYGQGLLTYSLLQGILGVATRKTASVEYIDIMKLFQYARDAVPELAKSINGIQTPMLGFPTHGASFDIGILNDEAKSSISISNKKPVMISSNFINLKTLRDDLRLEEELEARFRSETEKGKDADLIFVDAQDYPGAYSLGGYYELQEDGEKKELTININLFQGEKKGIPVEISRPSPKVRKLAIQILKEVKKKLE